MCVCVWHQASSAQLQSHGYGSPNSSLSARLSLQLLKICHVSESPERHCRCRTWCWGVPRGAPQPTGRQGLFFHLCVTLQGVAQPQSLHPFVSCDSEPVYYFTLVLSWLSSHDFPSPGDSSPTAGAGGRVVPRSGSLAVIPEAISSSKRWRWWLQAVVPWIVCSKTLH